MSEAVNENKGEYEELPDFEMPPDIDFKPGVPGVASLGVTAIEGAVESVVGKFGDSVFDEVVENVLPKGFNRALNTINKVVSLVDSNKRYVEKTLAAPIKEAKKLVGKHVDKLSGKLPQGIVDSLKEWSKVTPSHFARSESEMREESIANDLKAIFGVQHAVNERNRNEDLVRADAAERKRDAQYKETLAVSSNAEQYLAKLVNYQDTVTVNFQKKSLEVQLRQYGVMIETAETLRKSNDLIIQNLINIAHNTSLPEFAKTRNSDKFKDVLRTNIYSEGISKVGSLFANNDVFNRMMDVSSKRTKEYANQLLDVLQGGIDAGNMVNDTIVPMTEDMGKAEMASMGASIAGSWVGDKVLKNIVHNVGLAVSKGIKTFDPNDRIGKIGNTLDYIHDNQSAAIPVLKELIANQKDENGIPLLEQEGNVAGLAKWLVNFLDETQRTALGEVGTRTISKVNSGFFATEGVLSKAAVFSLEEIIPGWLQRIHHNTAIIATGDPDISKIYYSYDKNQFVGEQDYYKNIRNKLFEESSKLSLENEGERILDALDKEKELSPELREKILKKLLADNIDNLGKSVPEDLGNFDRITNAETWVNDDISSEEAESLAEKFRAAAGDQKHGEKHQSLTKMMGRYGHGVSDKRLIVQELATAGNMKLLEEIGVIDKTGSFDPDKYMELLHQKEIDFGTDNTFVNSSGIRNILSIDYARDRERAEKEKEENGREELEGPPERRGSLDHDFARDRSAVNRDLTNINGPISAVSVGSNTGSISEIFNINKKGAKGIIYAITTGTDRTVEKLSDLEKVLVQMRDQQQSKLSVGFDNSLKRLWAAGKWTIEKSRSLFTNIVLPGGKKAGGLVGKMVSGIGKALDWTNKKLQTIGDIYLEGENDPRMLAFKFKSGHYVCDIKNDEGVVSESRIIKYYTDIKGDVYDTADGQRNLVLPEEKIEYAYINTPLGKRRITAFGAGKSKLRDWANRHAILGAPIRAALNLIGNARNLSDKALGAVGGYFDVYLPSQETPVLHAWKIKQRRYFMRLEDGSTKYVTDIKDIIDTKADVYEKMDDGSEEIRLAMADAKNAYYKSSLGKQIFLWAGKFKDFIVEKVKPLEKLNWAAGKVMDLIDEPIDIYVKNDVSPNGVRLRATEMIAGRYICTITNTVIRRPSQIKGPVNKIVDGKVTIALSEEDIRIGICDNKGNPIRGVGKILFDAGKKALTWGVGAVKELWSKATDKLKQLMGFFGDVKGVNFGWFKEWLVRNPVVDELKEIKHILDERLPYADGTMPSAKNRRIRPGYIIDGNGVERKIGDVDNDGVVDGQERKDPDLPSVSNNQDPQQEEGPNKKPGFIRRMVGKLWDKFKGNTLPTVAGAGMAAAGGAAVAGGPAPAPATAPAAPEEEGIGSKALAYLTGGYLGTKLLGGIGNKLLGRTAATAAEAAPKGMLSRAAGFVGRNAWAATKNIAKFMFNPSRLALAGRALPFVGRALGFVLGGPVGWTLGLGMTAYGIYDYFKDSNAYDGKKLTYLRMLQYGFTDTHESKLGSIVKFEKILDKYVKFGEGGLAEIASTEYSDEEKEDIRGMFGIKDEDEAGLATFATWFRKRFKPVYLAHQTALKKLGIDKKLYELELEGKQLADYVQTVRGINVDYLETQSPFPNTDPLNATQDDVERTANELLAEAKVTKKENLLPKGGASAAAIAAGVNVENTPEEKPVTRELTELKQDSPYGESPNKPVAKIAGLDDKNDKKITSSEEIIARKENAKIGALEAVKYKSYGLIDLDAGLTNVLDKLEDVLEPFMTVNTVGNDGKKNVVAFNGNIGEIVRDVYSLFGVAEDDNNGLVAIGNYLRNRFIPVYVNYLMAIKSFTGKLDKSAKSALGPEGEYRAAIACRDSLDSDGVSVWNYNRSPWATGVKLNEDKLSTVANLEYLKSKLPATSADVKEEKVDDVRAEAKIKETKTKGEQYKDPAQEAKDKSTAQETPSGMRSIVNKWDDHLSSASQWASEKFDSFKDAIGLGGPKGASAGMSTSSMGIKVGAGGPSSAKEFKGDELVAASIAAGESGARKYNAYNRGTGKNDGDNKENLDLTKMTVSEIMRRQRLMSGHPDRLFAVGKYQITPDPLKAAVSFLRIAPEEKFGPELQERIFAEFLTTKQKGRGAIENYVRGKSNDINGAIDSIASEWAGVAGVSGRGKYDGDGANKASVSTAQITKSLNNSKAKYTALIQTGMNAAKAYGIAIGAYTDSTAGASSASSAGMTSGKITGPRAAPGSPPPAIGETRTGGPIATASTAAPTGGTPRGPGTSGLMPVSGGAPAPTGGGGPVDSLQGPTDLGNIDLSALEPAGNQSLEKLKKIDPTFLHYLALMAKDYKKATGKNLQFTSSFRSKEDQSRLAAGGNSFAAAPGSSPHEFGLAVDLAKGHGEELNKLGLLKKYGFTAPIGQEPWHIENNALSTMIAEAKKMTPAQRKGIITSSLGKGGDGIGLKGGAYNKKSRDVEYQKSLMGASGGKNPNPSTGLGSTPPIAPATANVTPEATSSANVVRAAVDNATVKAARNKASSSPKEATDHVDELMKVSYGFKNDTGTTNRNNSSRIEKENNQLAIESNNMLLAEMKLTNTHLSDIKKILSEKYNGTVIDKSDAPPNVDNKRRKDVFDRVTKGSAASQLPVDLGSSGII